jgi:predicted ribosomally synthesized peptide with SipW-like signal peptide
MIVGVAAIVAGATTAFFSDTETSSGNTFTAGDIDLKIDNTSYYNGVFNPSTSWLLKDLTNGDLFFNFTDLKPGDYGEDTISIHAGSNDAYVCAEVKLTSNSENGINEPETVAGDVTPNDGELASKVNFIWWADDGDNVLEVGEVPLPGGPLGTLGVGNSATVQLADSQQNIWSPNTPGPLPGGQTKYVGKAWCFGTLTTSPVLQDGLGSTVTPQIPNGTNGPDSLRGGGFTCDGSQEGNESQTDGMTADISFTAVQARHNPGFLCTPPREDQKATITVHKVLIKDNGGNETLNDFTMTIDGQPVAKDTPISVTVGTHTVSELGVSGYVATFSVDCDKNGDVTVAANDAKTCTVTNNDRPGLVTLVKSVVNPAQGDGPSSFTMRVNGVNTPSGTSQDVNANASTTITELSKTGYHFTSITGVGCPSGLGVDFSLSEGQSVTCTITNTHD